MKPTRAGRALAGGLMLMLLPLLLAGCRDEVTQVVLVVQSDLVVPSEVDGMDVTAIEGPFEPPVGPFFMAFNERLGPFPRSVGFQSGGATRSFSAVIRLFRGVFQTTTPTLVLSRAITNVPFVEEQTMMLVVSLNRACACNGTSCPAPGNPECDTLESPEVQPFDPAVAPPSTMMSPNSIGVGVGGGPVPRPTQPPPPPPPSP